jgi:hypothetical protein
MLRLNAPEVVLQTRTVRPPEPPQLCPWREPEADLKLLFPGATRCEVETRILSGLRGELQQRLGRPPTGDENALRLYRVYREDTAMGIVLTRRVKGEHGVIELVLGASPEGQVSGLRLQRLREPESVAEELQNSNWLRSFEGKRADSTWLLGRDIPQVPPPARFSAEAIINGTRSLLILLAAADHGSPPNLLSAHHQ